MEFSQNQGIELSSETSDVNYAEDADDRMALRQVFNSNQRTAGDSTPASMPSNQAVYAYRETFGNSDGTTVEREPERGSHRRDYNKECKGLESATLTVADSLQENSDEDFNWGEIDGLCCSICFEPWSSSGDHHVSSLACGHIYGLSCIKKWLRRQDSSQCPECNRKFKLKDIRRLYASRVIAIDGELQKKVRVLEVKCASLEKKNAYWSKKELEWKKKEADLCKQNQLIEKRKKDLEGQLEAIKCRLSGSFAPTGASQGFDVQPNFLMQWSSSKSRTQKNFRVDGARLFDIDSSGQVFVIARRVPRIGGSHVLTKMSLSSNHEMEDIQLPDNAKAVKDLHVSPHARHVLFATLGKKLSVISAESNNCVLIYDLPAAAWSCSWDVDSSHFLYAGLQNGTVLQFDMRQTRRPVESLTGSTGNPIHTIHCLATDSSLSSGVRSVLTASSVGVCQWNFSAIEQMAHLIPESDKHGVCISLAYSPTCDYIVASYRPKIELSGHMEVPQPTLTAAGQGVQGSHVFYKRKAGTYEKIGATGANVCDIRLPKSCIIDGISESPIFVSGDEETSDLVFQEVPSLMVLERLKPLKPLIRDLRYTRSSNSGFFGCLTEDYLQLFTAKLF